MLVTTSLTDTRVPFWIPLKYVAKLRHFMSSSHLTGNSLFLLIQEEGGHFGQWEQLDANELVSVVSCFFKVLLTS